MNMTLNEWYLSLVRYAADKGTSGLPDQASLSALYDAQMSVEDSYDHLYPQAVTITQDAQPEPATEVSLMTPEQRAALVLAQDIDIPRVTEKDILARIVNKTFSLTPSGRTIICEITMQNGFVTQGSSTPAAIGVLDDSIGQSNALTKAVHAVWPHEAYLLRERLYQEELKKRANTTLGIEQLNS